ncbi:all trans-polyprenyl-diphosphate synthase PDSS2-like isoform X3 [Amphiura filiformis]|uniref:all trans-polyprenyl-diphosphate synthase PDSS2-like isoform X1 n=1 Tax=Amphiura filiformis TaxID=82378 RepID=UPI003B226C2F
MNVKTLTQRCMTLSKSRMKSLANHRRLDSICHNVCISVRTVSTESRCTVRKRTHSIQQCITAQSQLRTFYSCQHVPIIGTSKLATFESKTPSKPAHQDTTYQTCRLFHKSPSHQLNLFGGSSESTWSSAISEAEKLVGYPASFMSLRYLLSDELANVALQARKLVGTKHPLLKMARNFVYDGKHSLQTRGLIVLLISKAAGPSEEEPNNTQEMVSGIYPSQRALAEISEMIHTAFLVHKGVVNLKDILPSDGPFKVMEFGNKMAVLGGDFLLANACTGLAQLRNTKVVDLISQAIGHLTEAAFMAGFAEDNGGSRPKRRLPYGVDMSDWSKYAYLSSGSLIAQSCKGALALAGHGTEMQEMAFDYGKNMAIAQKLHSEIQPFTARGSSEFGLMSAPVLLHMEYHRDTQASGYDDETWKHSRVDVKKLYQEICSSPAMERAQELCSDYAQKAMNAIASFPSSKAKQALINMVKAVSR